MTKARNKTDDSRSRLEALIAKSAGKKTFDKAERRMLMRALSEAASAYNRIRWSAEDASRSTFHELGAPLARVIGILKHEASLGDGLVALGAPARDSSVLTRLTWPERDRAAVHRARARYDALLSALDHLARAVPLPPPRPAHRPVENNDLRAAVEVLAAYWERMTGAPVAPYWVNGVPANAATQFIYDAMRLIGCEHLGGLRKVLDNHCYSKTVAARRRRGRGSKRDD
jgi:hypothetical protein